jgi:hypothetical protein
MATPPPTDFGTIVVTSLATNVTPSDMAATIATVRAVVASRERVAGAAVAASALVGPTDMCPHSTVRIPFSIVGVSAPTGLTMNGARLWAFGAAGPFAAVGIVGAAAGVVVAPAGTIAGAASATATTHLHPQAGLPFSATDASTLTGPTTGAADPLAAIVSVGAPALSSFHQSMGGAPY